MDNLIVCLALYQHRQDKAVGINWLSGQTRGLLWYYNYLQIQEIEKPFHIAYYTGIIQQGAVEIKKLVEQAEKSENKGKLLERALAINTAIQVAKKELDELQAR